MDEKLNELEKTLEGFIDYSYGFNVKLLGLPQLSPTEEAHETSSLCVKLFNAMGAMSVSINDIDIAHRVPTRVAWDGPKPVICEFTRRLARNAVMAVRREISSVSPTDLGLPADEDLSHTRVVDHLSPKRQQLYTDAKNFKSRYNFNYCWVKNGVILLRKTEDSSPVKKKKAEDLYELTRTEEVDY